VLYHVTAITTDCRHVFNDHIWWTENFGGSRHERVKAVAAVSASSVVVQIRMSLARRTTNKHMNWPNLSL
jgi:hypothetical protein